MPDLRRNWPPVNLNPRVTAVRSTDALEERSILLCILIIAAHPDDVDFGSARTIAGGLDAGASVSYCIVTSGEAGGSDRSVSRPEMVTIRQAEQQLRPSR